MKRFYFVIEVKEDDEGKVSSKQTTDVSGFNPLELYGIAHIIEEIILGKYNELSKGTVKNFKVVEGEKKAKEKKGYNPPPVNEQRPDKPTPPPPKKG